MTTDRGKVKCPDRNLSGYHSLHHKSHMNRPGIETWLCTDTTATTCWSHGMASFALVLPVLEPNTRHFISCYWQ